MIPTILSTAPLYSIPIHPVHFVHLGMLLSMLTIPIG